MNMFEKTKLCHKTSIDLAKITAKEYNLWWQVLYPIWFISLFVSIKMDRNVDKTTDNTQKTF